MGVAWGPYSKFAYYPTSKFYLLEGSLIAGRTAGGARTTFNWTFSYAHECAVELTSSRLRMSETD